MPYDRIPPPAGTDPLILKILLNELIMKSSKYLKKLSLEQKVIVISEIK
jgi:hypothetical protein